MDLYVDRKRNRRSGGHRRSSSGMNFRKRRMSKKPIIIIVCLAILIVAGIFGVRFVKKMQADRQKRKEMMATISVTFPEGYSIDMMAAKMEEEDVFSKEEFLNAVKDTSLYKNQWINDLPKSTQIKYQLEGYLYPDTYNIYKKAKPQDLIQKMLDNFEDKYEALAKTYEGKRSMGELVTMAALIERETSVQNERPIIAGVIENRIKAKMRLQIDPSVVYAITDGMYDVTRVYYSDLQVKSPYNTYLNKGLPVGPICNPDESAIQAAMNPEKHRYFYYHSDEEKKDGSHIFNQTYAEHQQSLDEQKDKK